MNMKRTIVSLNEIFGDRVDLEEANRKAVAACGEGPVTGEVLLAFICLQLLERIETLEKSGPLAHEPK